MKEILLAVMAMLNFGCPDLSSQYGKVTIKSPTGEGLYFRREARGLNFDSLSLTTNSDHCHEPDPSADIIFVGLGSTQLFYKFEGEELHLYLVNVAASTEAFSGKTKVVQHKLTNPEFMAMRESYNSKGLQLVDVPLDKSLNCE